MWLTAVPLLGEPARHAGMPGISLEANDVSAVSGVIACVLTPCVTSGGCLVDGMPGCGGTVPPFGASGACLGGFGGAGRRTGQRDQAMKIPADPAGCEFPGLAAAFPALPVVFGNGPGQAELGDRGDDEPGPAGDLTRVAERGLVPARGVLGEPVCVLDVKAVQVGAPDQVQVRGARAGPPQPQRP